MAKGIKTGGGSRKGIPNKATAAQARAIAKSGLTPLQFMLSVMRDPDNALPLRTDAAKAAAPYIHPRLNNIEHSGKDGGPLILRVTGLDSNL